MWPTAAPPVSSQRIDRLSIVAGIMLQVSYTRDPGCRGMISRDRWCHLDNNASFNVLAFTVTWADHSLGKAIAKLETFGPAVVQNTIVLFHSDHGYQLGELNEW